MSLPYPGLFPAQRVFAAFLAMDERRAAVNDAALALPPFTPPSRPSATAAGFLPSGSADTGVRSTVRSTMNLASWLASRGRLPGQVPSKRARSALTTSLP